VRSSCRCHAALAQELSCESRAVRRSNEFPVRLTTQCRDRLPGQILGRRIAHRQRPAASKAEDRRRHRVHHRRVVQGRQRPVGGCITVLARDPGLRLPVEVRLVRTQGPSCGGRQHRAPVGGGLADAHTGVSAEAEATEAKDMGLGTLSIRPMASFGGRARQRRKALSSHGRFRHRRCGLHALRWRG